MIYDLRFTRVLNKGRRYAKIGIALMAFGFLLTPCKGGDEEIRQQVVGNWAIGKYYTTTFGADGSFNSKIAAATTNGIHTNNWSGTWKVQNGIMIFTITNRFPDPRGTRSVNPNDISRSSIVNLDASNLVLVEYGITNSFSRK
jgi:hypothetical protein